MDGFADGAAAYAEETGTATTVVGWDKAAQNGSMIGNFSDTEAGRTTTEQFINDGADVILPVAGPVGSGALNAASQAEGTAVIWVDSDGYLQPANEQYKGLILTSVMKQIQTAVFETIKSSVDGEFSSDPYVGTLENGGVDIAPFHDWKSKVPANRVKIDERASRSSTATSSSTRRRPTRSPDRGLTKRTDSPGRRAQAIGIDSTLVLLSAHEDVGKAGTR